MVEPTHLKNISQNGNLPQIGVKIKNIWNHHPDEFFPSFGILSSKQWRENFQVKLQEVTWKAKLPRWE